MKRSLIVSGCLAILTFAVSIPVNLLGTSLVRAMTAFLFFMVSFLVVPWLFRRLSAQKALPEKNRDSHAGQQIDLRIREDQNLFDEVYASHDPSPDNPDQASDDDHTFKPLSAPKLDTEQLVDVIRKQTRGQ